MKNTKNYITLKKDQFNEMEKNPHLFRKVETTIWRGIYLKTFKRLSHFLQCI